MGHKLGEQFPLFLGQEILFASDKMKYAIITGHFPAVREVMLTREDGMPCLISYDMVCPWDDSNYQVRWENEATVVW